MGHALGVGGESCVIGQFLLSKQAAQGPELRIAAHRRDHDRTTTTGEQLAIGRNLRVQCTERFGRPAGHQVLRAAVGESAEAGCIEPRLDVGACPVRSRSYRASSNPERIWWAAKTSMRATGMRNGAPPGSPFIDMNPDSAWTTMS